MKLVSMFLPAARGDNDLPADVGRVAEQAVYDEATVWPWYMWTLFFWLG